MATALALRFLPIFLFFFMNGHGIGARDLKGELQDQKEVDSHGATSVSRDEPYTTGYITTPDTTQPNYKASYTSKKHNHPSHHAKLNEPYITGYITTPDSTQPDYISSYTSMKHNHLSHHGKLNNEPYIAGYISTPDSTQAGYISSYTSMKHNHPSHHGKLKEPYIAGYITSNQEVKKPYITGYVTSNAHEANQHNTYLTGYRTSTHDSNKDFSIWATNKAYRTPLAHEANQPYTAGYKPTPHDSNQHAYDAKEDSKEAVHDTNEPYIAQYGGTSPNKDQKESAKAQDSTKSYATNYSLRPKRDSKESAVQDSDEPYITQYIGPKNHPKESGQDHSRPYITQCGSHDHRQDPKESTQGYTATYKKKTEDSKGGPSSNVDHTEAFKTGFFTLDDLYVGNIMTLQFPVQEFSHFLSRKEADSIPFSTSQLSSVLQLFSISEDSPEAESMRGTLEQCEAGTITGETKICANSLESMLEFVGTIIGSEAKYNILTTNPPSGAPLQKHTILEVSQDIYAPKWVACHPLPYPYAVYYCHFIATGSKVFKVLLSGENGDKMEALGICHLDSSDWSPNHILFRQLGIKPGEAPVCHFFPVKHLMWVPQHSTATM